MIRKVSRMATRSTLFRECIERKPKHRFSSEDGRRILVRAKEIEKLDRSSISKSELKAFASETQIDNSALSRA